MHDLDKMNEHNARAEQFSALCKDLIPPAQVSLNHPWITRYASSAILDDNVGSDLISTADREVYGDPAHPIAFRIGNGGAGFTGVLRSLALDFISKHGADFRIAWVFNHSRHTQIALLADVVQVALTYEPAMEKLAEQEGWCRGVLAPVFWDHFILIGPKINPARLAEGCGIDQAMRDIAQSGGLFHTRGDGSATYEKEQVLWREAKVDITSALWLEVHGSSPYSALQEANEGGAYLLIDRATFLTAKNDGVIPSLVVYVEGSEQLRNPCAALVNTRVPDTPTQSLAVQFAEWLGGDAAQINLEAYGRDWSSRLPLFTAATNPDFPDEECLAGRAL